MSRRSSSAWPRRLGLAGLCLALASAGCASPPDRFETFNRGVFAFNEAADRWVVRPVALGWDFVMPDRVETAIDDFFENLRMPVYFGNNLLQGRPDRAAIAAKVDALGPEMVGNLAQHGFLNQWQFDGEPVTGLSGSFVGTRVTRDQLELTFRLDLDKPLDRRGGRFEYSVFDPTYYIEILHARRHLPELRGAPRGCRREIIEPDPPEDLTAFAASLDRNAQSDEGLGIHFAERAVIECRG